eukprot:3041700-Rhodomonas_salina.1
MFKCGMVEALVGVIARVLAPTVLRARYRMSSTDLKGTTVLIEATVLWASASRYEMSGTDRGHVATRRGATARGMLLTQPCTPSQTSLGTPPSLMCSAKSR